MPKSVRCLLRSHGWVQKVQAGESYYRCGRCGKERDPNRTPLPIFWWYFDRR